MSGSPGLDNEALVAPDGALEDLRVGLSWGLLAGVVAAVPSVSRSVHEGIGAGALGAVACALALGGALGAGLQLAGGRRLMTLGVGISLAFLPLAVFGQWLSAATHHRPLGAVTFAVAALGVVVGALLVSARLVDWARGKGTKKTVATIGIALSTALSIGLFLRGMPGLWTGARAGLVDGGLLLGGLGLLFAVRRASAPWTQLLRRPAGWIWLACLVLAFGFSVAMPDALGTASALLSFPFRALVGAA